MVAEVKILFGDSSDKIRIRIFVACEIILPDTHSPNIANPSQLKKQHTTPRDIPNCFGGAFLRGLVQIAHISITKLITAKGTMAPEPPPPFPIAANRDAIANTLSLLLASRTSIGKSMPLTRDLPRKPRTVPDDNDDDLTRGARPNEGLGYVPEKKEVEKFANSKEERMLRGRLNKDAKGKLKKKAEESESEDEAGRSALGKRKRPRKEKEVDPEPVSGNQTAPATTEDNEKNGNGGKAEVDTDMKDVVIQEEPSCGDRQTEKKRKKNKKKKQKTAPAVAEAEAEAEA
ncbi:hypothetical protein FGADI_4828 [Fusarium gaditjirri]|uniref:Uncharacterized protein n=1 Tax=Fusarium gaditjirri TaxID=282569 RepID=A0A8H4WY34_9HYPO|nr:hypothetical protein FGADI_4828 [Fusarium gaditjirri]